jgi:hypothetical protein
MKVILSVIFPLFISLASQAQLSTYCYYGNIHSHTDYSGGVGVPLNAFNYANNNSDLDFLAVTDHLESIYYSSFEWDSIKISANEASITNLFIGMAGYEWTSPNYNHVNVFNTSGMVSPLNVNNWDAFLADLSTQPNAIAQFNHPGLIGSNNWNNFTYKSAILDSIFRLIEVKKFSDDVYYQMALNNGWHVSPTNNQDNHEWNWGTMDDKRTGIWTGSLTYNSIIDAILKRRTFSTEDKNARILMEFNGQFMGSFTTNGANSSIRVFLDDENGEFWNEVKIIGTNNTTVYSGSFNQSLLDTVLNINTLGLTWIYIRARQPDGDYIWSAPIYLTPASSSEEKNISEFTLSIFPNPCYDYISLTSGSTSCEKGLITITDIYGKNVFSRNFTSLSLLSKLDISSLQQGMYIISIVTDTEIGASRFLKLK